MKHWPAISLGVGAIAVVIWFGTHAPASTSSVSEAQRRPDEPIKRSVVPAISPKLVVEQRTTPSVITENSALRNSMTRVEDFKNAGRATPEAAFQTLIWAAIKGDDDELAATLMLTDSAREKADEWRMALPAEIRQKYATVEKLPGLFLTEEIVRKAASAQILESIEHSPDRVTLRVKTSTLGGGTGVSEFLLTRGDRGWGIEIPEDMIAGMRKQTFKTGMSSARTSGNRSIPLTGQTPLPAAAIGH